MVLRIFFFFFILPFIMGICEFLFLIRYSVFSSSSNDNQSVIVFLYPDIAELQLSSVLFKKKWYGKFYCGRIYAYTYYLTNDKSNELKDKFYNQDLYFVERLEEILIYSEFNNGRNNN